MATLIKSPGVLGAPIVLGRETTKPVDTARKHNAIAPAALTSSARGDSPEADSSVDSAVGKALSQQSEPVSFEDILAAHQSKIDALEADAVERGYAKGLKTGQVAGEASYLEALRRLEQRTDELGKEAERVVLAAEDLIGEIVFQVVSRIVGTQLMTPEGVRGVVAESIGQIKRSQILAIRMSSQDAALLATTDDAGMPIPDRVEFAGIPVETDDSMPLGGCIVEIVGGRLDARIETQFRQFAQSLKDYRSGK